MGQLKTQNRTEQKEKKCKEEERSALAVLPDKSSSAQDNEIRGNLPGESSKPRLLPAGAKSSPSCPPGSRQSVSCQVARPPGIETSLISLSLSRTCHSGSSRATSGPSRNR